MEKNKTTTHPRWIRTHNTESIETILYTTLSTDDFYLDPFSWSDYPYSLTWDSYYQKVRGRLQVHSVDLGTIKVGRDPLGQSQPCDYP